MGDITRNISRKEFACNCGCGYDTVDHELATVIQNTIYHFENKYQKKVIVIITGPNRCVKYNKKVGGAKNSQHIFAKAADHKFFIIDEFENSKKQIEVEEVYNYYNDKYNNKYGIGIYSNRIHLDSRGKRARWDSR